MSINNVSVTFLPCKGQICVWFLTARQVILHESLISKLLNQIIKTFLTSNAS